MVENSGGRRVFGAHWAFVAFFAGVVGYHLVTLVTTAAVNHQTGDDDPLDLPAGPALLLAFLPNLVLGLGPVAGSLRFGAGLERDFGLRATWRDIRIGLACGALALVVGYLLNLGVLAVYGGDDVSDSPLTDLPDVSDGSYAWVAAAAAILIVVVPLTEELLVRGTLWNALVHHRVPSWVVLVLTALVFAQLHGESTRMIALFGQGLVLGLARYRSGRTAASMVAHAANNLPPAVLLFTGH
ncbi:CPBP family intramembrane glutamic endopeptidase [Amycolatopsis jiangsuensis]|uniref:Membrane protease YdiL (CAAX protease family) n=1 Tax=Amycolatopsis jiangsuensis TaxID=1181879 RepID=A0A840IVS1_9PSEU|nr:CPBP family intramembrane glutamic endopeptidase [Amycolatopsis jiangsuensis]MBB4685302.1 membrane protease YdiL (CAAX protease family) [Amycolatopsis jiangsuensis]